MGAHFFFFFFTQVFLRPAHYTLGTLLGPKSQKKQELGCFEHLEFIPGHFLYHQCTLYGPAPCRKIENLKKKKNPNFFFTSVLRPAHYTLGTLLGPKSQKKQELGCFEHLELIPQSFSVPPVHFVWVSALSKNRKSQKKKIFFFGKISTPELGPWVSKYAKNTKILMF